MLWVIFFLTVTAPSHAYTFNQAINTVNTHPKIGMLLSEVSSLQGESETVSSWGDPQFGVKARNVPVDTLSFNESPMTGIEYSVSQNLPLTTKYSHMKDSLNLLAEAKELDAAHQRKALQALLWNYAIAKRRVSRDIAILDENLGFLENMLKVTNRLYANGKVGQQAVLELQIRKSELEAQLVNNRHQLRGIEASLKYFGNGLKGELDLNSVPWGMLGKKLDGAYQPDEKELGLNKVVASSNSALSAQKLAFVPDVSLSLAYIQRSKEVDDFGNFASAGIFFSLPLSSQKRGLKDSAYANKLKAENELRNYRLKRASKLKRLEQEILKVRGELDILGTKTVPFARTSRQITSKSYGLGSATYVELTQAEIKLQNLLMRQNDLKGMLASKMVEYRFLNGETLYEN